MKPPQTPRLVLVMIVKDEEAVIERALNSALPFIDRACVIDTGSTDQTREIIRSFCLRHNITLVMADKPWVSFGHNRTEVIELARQSFPDGYGLLLDADDTIEAAEGWDLPLLVHDLYDNPVRYAGLSYTQPHVIRLAHPWYFEGSTHEYLESRAQGYSRSTLDDMVYRINSDGHDRSTGRKFKRDIDLLSKEVRKNPKDARSAFYLAQSFRDDGQTRRAYAMYRERANLVGWVEETYIAKLEAAKLAEKLPAEIQHVPRLYLEAHEYRPTRAEALYYLSYFYRRAERYELAYRFGVIAASIRKPADRLFVEDDVYAYKALDEAAIAAFYVEGRRAECAQMNIELLSRVPIWEKPRIMRHLAMAGGPVGVNPGEHPGVTHLRSEYELETLPDFPTPPVVVDVGANLGHFARYARQRWPLASVHCYEPHPDTFAKLRAAQDLESVAATQVAITHPARGRVKLFEGVNDRTEASLRDDVRWPHVSQRLNEWVEVDTADASILPPCDVLKVDTEGSELEIIEGYPHLDKTRILLCEAHPVGGDLQGQVDAIGRVASRAGMHLLDRRGCILRFVRRSPR